MRDAAEAVTGPAPQSHAHPRRRRRPEGHIHREAHPNELPSSAADLANPDTLDPAASAVESDAAPATDSPELPDVEPAATLEELTPDEREQAARVLAEGGGAASQQRHRHVPVDPATLPDPRCRTCATFRQHHLI